MSIKYIYIYVSGSWWLTASPRPASPKSPPPDNDSHKNEGFLKSAWHKLTHQHDQLEANSTSSKPEEKENSEEPKKAAGSG